MTTVSLVFAGGQQLYTEKQPNFLYIMSDDHATINNVEFHRH